MRREGADPLGPPRLLYHGTTTRFDQFDLTSAQRRDSGNLGRGIYLTADLERAMLYAEDNTQRWGGTPTVLTVEARLGKTAWLDRALMRRLTRDAGITFPPEVWDYDRSERMRDWFLAHGFDAVENVGDVAVFDPRHLRIVGEVPYVPSRERLRVAYEKATGKPFSGTNPQASVRVNPTDREYRAAERAAAAGDPEAQLRLDIWAVQEGTFSLAHPTNRLRRVAKAMLSMKEIRRLARDSLRERYSWQDVVAYLQEAGENDARRRDQFKSGYDPGAAYAALWLDEGRVGTPLYGGIAYFWNYDYRHTLREVPDRARKAVHDTWLKHGLALDGESPEHVRLMHAVLRTPGGWHWEGGDLVTGWQIVGEGHHATRKGSRWRPPHPLPNPPSKARLKRRLAASGWTVRKPQAWLTIYTAPSGLVEIWDQGRPHPERYMVMTRYPGERYHGPSYGAPTFDDAVRVAIQDLGLVEPLPNPRLALHRPV